VFDHAGRVDAQAHLVRAPRIGQDGAPQPHQEITAEARTLELGPSEHPEAEVRPPWNESGPVGASLSG
jgi:hypothetical protein